MYGRFFNCESTQDALGIYFLFLYLCHIYLIKENISLNSRGKNKRYLFIFINMCEVESMKSGPKNRTKITFSQK